MLDGENNLIYRAIKGESSAFGSLYDYYQPQIYRFIYLKVSHREEAEDLTHQVFLSAWHSMESYRHKGFPFSSWLYEIARNKVIDFYRAKKDAVSLESIQDLPASGEHTLAEDMETRLAMAKIKGAMLGLKPEHQEVIILRYIEDLSLKEASAIMGKTEGAVKLLQHRAVKSLKDNLTNSQNYI